MDTNKNYVNTTEQQIFKNGKEVPTRMPSYVRDGKVHRLDAPQENTVYIVPPDVYKIESKKRSDLEMYTP